jgi:hypothetical protein
MEGDNGTKGIIKRKKEGEGLRHIRNHSSLNFNGIHANSFVRENRC